MARTDLTPVEIVGPYPSLPPTALSLDHAFVAADVVNGNQFASSGNDLILVKNNGGASPFYFTITSKEDELNRTGDLDQYDVGIDLYSSFKTKNKGWRQADGKIYLDAEDVAIEFAILRL